MMSIERLKRATNETLQAVHELMDLFRAIVVYTAGVVLLYFVWYSKQEYTVYTGLLFFTISFMWLFVCIVADNYLRDDTKKEDTR